MPCHHHLGAAFQHPAMRDHSTPAPTPLAITSQHALHITRSHTNAPTDYDLQMVQANTRTGHRLPVSHFSQQQQKHHQPCSQQPHVQSKPTHKINCTSTAHASSRQRKAIASSAVSALLPHYTADAPLSGSQVIAVTDVAGSLKELVGLALGAKNGDEECVRRLESALGSGQATAGLLDFFSDEYETV